MPDLKKALKDFVATSNSGKYTDEKVLLSKFPELKGYDIETLKDFVATSNSGKYTDENELFSKFPEFNTGGAPLKKKGSLASATQPMQGQNTTELPSADGSSATQLPKKSRADARISQSLGQINTDLMNDTEENVVSKLGKDKTLKDLGFSFEESGAFGDYMVVTAPDGKTTKEISLDNFLDSKSATQSAELQKFIKQNTSKAKRAELEQIAQIEESDIQKSKANKKKFGQEFDQGAKTGFNKKNSKYLNDRLKTINPELINQNEEYVVPQMNYQFGDLGFKFEESGATGDWMTVTAPDGKTKIEISIDPFSNNTAVAESTKLQNFIKTYTPDKGLYVIEKSANEGNQKLSNQKQVDASIKKISDEANVLNANLKTFLAKKAKFDKMPQGSAEYNTLQAELIADRDILMQKQNSLKTKEVLLKKSVGKYTEMKSQQGTYLAGTWNALMDAYAGATAGISDLAIDMGAEIMPNEMMMSPKDLKDSSVGIAKKLGIKGPSEKQTFAQWKATLTEDQQDDVEDEMDDVIKKSMKKDIIPAIRQGNRQVFGSSTATPEWEQLQSEDFWAGSYFGLVKTIPALAGGAGPAGWTQRTATMYSMVSDGIRQEMDKNPEFAKVSENEKLAVVLPIGITGAVLEEFGLRNIKGSTGLINKMAMKALGKSTSKTTAKTFRELVENEVESAIAKGLLVTTSAGLAEAESGALQELTETGVKEIYNEIKDKKMFETPDTAGQWVANVVKAGAQEAVGGVVLGMPTAVSAAYSQKGFLNMSDQNFRLFEAASQDENIQKAFITNLKTQITQGVITTADAKEQLNNYRNSVGLFKSLPDGLNTKQKKEAMNLLKEKRDLQNQVDGKDPSLVKKQKERIDAIDASLVGISEAAANEKATAEANRKEFDALPDSEKIKLKDEAGRKLLDMVGDRNDEDVFLDDETLTEFAFKDFVKQKEANNRIAEIEATLSPDAETPVVGRAKRKLEKELGKLKNTQDAIQEQTTDEGLLRTEQAGMGLQGVGEGNAQPQATSSTETIINAKSGEVREPSIVVHSTADERGFALNYSEGVDEANVTTPTDPRGFPQNATPEQRQEFGKGNAVITTNEVAENGDKNISFVSEVQDFAGRAGGTVFDFVIPNGNTATAEGIKNIYDEVRKDLKGKELINETVKQVKEYINSNNPSQEIDLGLDIPENPLMDIQTTDKALFDISQNEEVSADFGPQWYNITENLIDEKKFDDRLNDDNYSPYTIVSEEYHKAKIDGSNPELVKAVEDLLVPSSAQPTTQIQTDETTTTTNEVQPEPTGNGGTRRTTISKTTPLEGAPTVQGATGPDEQLVSVAEKYAAENGIDLKRQGEYVEVDEDRAKRIADAYEEMANDPQNPKVKEAYAELIKQTKAQYQALVDAGYKFWFIDLNNPDNIDYISSPYNAMRDLRQNKQMGVFPTDAGFGSDEDVDVSNNPLLEDTGIMWSVGGLDGEMKAVTANDLFRAVHDAFGHGLEGAGFRARGEENAFQAHSRLYTGAAVGAMASETRGQNSWVNFGPNGETNRDANAEDTVFADQKTGLMPEWTWTEGLASDMGAEQAVAENLAEENAPEEVGTQGLSEAELPGYDRMISEVEGIVEKSKKRRVSNAKMLDNVMSYVTGSKVYESATDVQREALVRKIRKDFGLREKSAPSVAKLFGKIKDVTKITMTEKAALIKQIKDLGKGAKEAVRAWRLASEQLSKDIKELKESGKITSDQAANVIRAFSNVNVFSQKSVDRFTQYMTKVFEKADYANKISKAKKTRTDIKRLSKDKTKNANLRDLAYKFGKIDPSIVADIDAYNELAEQIKNATDGSKIRGQKINWAETVNIANATDYVNQEMESQNKILRDERLAELEEIYGVDGFNFTDEEIKALLESDEDISDEDGKVVMATIKKAFNIYSTLIQDSIKNGVDAFTGEDVTFTKKEKETIAKFMSMDLSKMGNKNALQAVDALANFIENKSTAKMAATIATYVGDTNADIIVQKGIYAMPLKKMFSPQFGAFLAEQTTTLPMVFEKMFKGFNRGGTVMDAMGLTKLINRKSFAERQANNIVADYVKEFYNKNSRPNGQAFNTAYNNTERGMAAFMLRSVIGTEQEMEAEFNRRKGLIEQSIKALSEGNKEQKKKAEIYQKVYDKVVVNAKNLQDIKDNTDSKNLEAIDYWRKQWESKFDQLSDVASGIYNKVLGKDLNYSSPDKYSKMKASKDVDLINNNESAFIGNTNGILYNKKTGVLMDVTNPSNLPTSNKKVTSYVDLSFDKNNSNSMYDALVDIETAEPIRQVQAFLNSDSYNKIIPDVDNAEMLAKRIDTYVQNIRKKNPYSNDEFSKTIKKLNKMATLGVGQALGGVTQPLKQVIPVALNTLINGQGLSVGASFDSDFVSWLNGTGYAIANRGIKSQADIENLNNLLEEAANSKGQAMLNKIQEANAFMLKWFLEKPDVFIAKASWKTYYEKSLKQQGIDPSSIDYKDHEVNEDAANYAQRMVDRQQNISDSDLAGNLFTDKTSKAQVLAKIFMPFASFRMNQASRLASDLSVLGHWSVSTAEDKKIALLSLSSFATEMAVFKAISAGIGIAMGYAANAWMDRPETEDEEDKRINNILKGAATGAITDVVSPLPIFDKLLQTGAASVLDGVQEGLDITEQDKLALYSAKPQDYLKNLGLYGMAPDRILEFGKLVTMATTGEYTDDFGKKHILSSKDKETLSIMIAPALLTNVGLAPSEVAGVVRNSIKVAKKKGKTTEEMFKDFEEVQRIEKMIQDARNPEAREAAERLLIKKLDPESLQSEKEMLKELKPTLLVDEENNRIYENETDLKRYNRSLWEKNFGEGSQWYKMTHADKEATKLENAKEREAKDKEYGYVSGKKKKRRKNSDGSRKSYRKTYSSGEGSGTGAGGESNSTYSYKKTRADGSTTTIKGKRRKTYD